MTDRPAVPHPDPDSWALPIAVYGTLRPGCGNDRLWRDRAAAIGTADVPGYALYSAGGFPYAWPDEGAHSVVTLVHPHDDEYDAVLARMDVLEGVHHGHYTREFVTVRMHESGVRMDAWMYVAGRSPTDLPLVPRNSEGSHDWLARLPVGDLRRVQGRGHYA